MKPKVDTVVQFSGLKPGRYEYDFTLDNTFFEGYENEELREGNVDFKVALEKHERMLLFNFSFQGEVKMMCDRCLGDMLVPIEGGQSLCVKFSDTETSDDVDVLFLPEDAYQIDLAQWMYEYVVLSIPMQHIHPEGGCDPEMLKYISEEHQDGESCGEEKANDGECDPRWDALKQLLEK